MVIPKEKLFSFQRWETAPLNKKQVAPPSTPSTIVEPPTVNIPTPEALPQFQLPTASEIEDIHENARALGYEAGFAEGKAAFAASTSESMEIEAQRFGDLITNLKTAIADLDQSVADQLLALAIEIAAQVTRGSIAAKNDILLPVVREAIASLPLHHANLSLRLNPADAGYIRDQLGEQFAQTGAQIIDDNTIQIGGCMLQAGASEVDATIETRWKRVLEAIGTEPQKWLTP